jgi:hypothetical protein
LVPGRVSSPIVHGLQAVHIDERDDQRDALAPSPIDLVLHLSKAWATTQHPGEVIDQVVLPLVAVTIERSLGSIEPCLITVQGSLLPVQGGLFPMHLPVVTRVGGASFKGRLIPVQPGLLAVKHHLISI